MLVIHEPELAGGGTEISVSCRVELDHPGAEYPPTLSFTFPKRYERAITRRADGFAASLLPLAMRLGEDLRVHGGLSTRLARGLLEYQRIQCSWKPDFFKEVRIEYDGVIVPPEREGGGAVGSAFSGGVDSFHTLWAHLPENEADEPYRISHCVMISGFDPDLDVRSGDAFARKRRMYELILQKYGLELIVTHTNLLEFLGNEIQKQAFAAFVTAPALILAGLFSRYYVPSSYQFMRLKLFPDGSHPMMDYLLATESLETIHDGGTFTRVEKTERLMEWSDTYHSLRPCSQTTTVKGEAGVLENCCRCEKCRRTMTTLEMFGALERFVCFPRGLTRRDVRNAKYYHTGTRIFAREIIDRAGELGRRDIAFDLRCAIWKSLLLWKPLRLAADLNYKLEQRNRSYERLTVPLKRWLKKRGWGWGWLYPWWMAS